MKAPRILISGIDGNRRKYELAVRRAGAKPVSCYCPSPQIPAEALLLAGGGDISPDFLGEEDGGSREIDLARDVAEFALVKTFLLQKKPIFGICRGHQVLNVAMGGKLVQDIGLDLECFHSPVPHGRDGDVYHLLATKEGSLMATLYGSSVLVNSWHHQAVSQVGEGFVATAWSESGMIEATEHQSLPIFSVQFHPERLRETEGAVLAGNGDALFAHFVALCRST